MSPWDFFLLGTYMVKDPARLIAAYDDSEVVSADFNLNLLRVLNHTLNADFDPSAFRHIAEWNANAGRMEMRLAPDDAQKIRIADLELDVVFEAGERMLTEISTKFTPAQVSSELESAGFEVDCVWHDRAGDFQLTLVKR